MPVTHAPATTTPTKPASRPVLRVTAREARLLRMRMMVICMQRRPEKARQWLLRMNRIHCSNPEILQILSDLAAMQEYGVQKCGVALPGVVGGAGGALGGDGGTAPNAAGRAGGPVGGRVATRVGSGIAGAVNLGGGIVGSDGLSSTRSEVENSDVIRAT